MNIPQNRVLFDDVIKYAVHDVKQTDEADGTVAKKRTVSVEEEMENEIKAIRNRMRRELPKVKEENPLEFMKYLIANYDYNHDCWKLVKDLEQKLKNEASVEAFMRS